MVRKIGNFNIPGLPSRTEVRTALAVTIMSNKEIAEAKRIAEEKEREKEIEEYEKALEIERENVAFYYTNKKTKITDKKDKIISTPNIVPTPTIVDLVPDSMKKLLCGNIRGLVGRIRPGIPNAGGTSVHALTLLHRLIIRIVCMSLCIFAL